MIQKLSADNHRKPYRGPISITRVQPGDIFADKRKDTAFGPLSVIDHATMKGNLTIKMHEHVNDEIFSYVRKGSIHHRDSAGEEAEVSLGQLMLMNAGESFWHEEKVKGEEVEMLQIFVRPRKADLEPMIQFQEKEPLNRDWVLMVGPENSDTSLYVRQNVYILDAHPKQGDKLTIPVHQGLQPFLYVMGGEIEVADSLLKSQEAVIDLENPLPRIKAMIDSTVLLFFVDMDAPMSSAGTISGIRERK